MTGMVVEVRSSHDGALVGKARLHDVNPVDAMLARADALHLVRRSRLSSAWQCWSAGPRSSPIAPRRWYATRRWRTASRSPTAGSSARAAAVSRTAWRYSAHALPRGADGLTPAASYRLAFTSHAPIGPVIAIFAFKHPANLVVHYATWTKVDERVSVDSRLLLGGGRWASGSGVGR